MPCGVFIIKSCPYKLFFTKFLSLATKTGREIVQAVFKPLKWRQSLYPALSTIQKKKSNSALCNTCHAYSVISNCEVGIIITSMAMNG